MLGRLRNKPDKEKAMIVEHEKNVIANIMNSPEVKNAAMKVLVGEREGWSDHVMRIVELDRDGYSPRHAHPWPHINYMIAGRGTLLVDGEEHPVESGSFACVPAGKEHQFRNTGEEPFRFICIVPKGGHQ
jgi:quercetin dioxygenase-like cupin family protein